MNVLAKYKAKDHNYGIVSPILIIFIKIQKFIRIFRKLVYKFLYIA